MADDERMLSAPLRPQFNREQKVAFGLILGFGSLALLLGSFYLWRHVASPFAISYTGPRFLVGDEEDNAEALRQQQTDTDSDGVSDYDELYIYKTSPYLADSDSDGQTDKVEIDTGADPNCAPGAACDRGINSDDAVRPSGISGGVIGDTIASGQNLPGGTPEEQLLATLQNFTVAEIRQLLISSDIPEETVNAMSDEEVQATFQEIIDQLIASGALESIVAQMEAAQQTSVSTSTQ